MIKKIIESIKKKNAVFERILDLMIANSTFLILGHENPDEDCISSTVALGLLLSKLGRKVFIYQGFPIHEHFSYLMNICRYNSIGIIKSEKDLPASIDVIAVCDTPKPQMIDCGPRIRKRLGKDTGSIIEFDHHIGVDSEYAGTPELAMVTEASSASELIGYFGLKLRNRKELLKQYNIDDPLTRNFVLAVLTGIVGDSKMGNFLKSTREKRYYEIFSTIYSRILMDETTKKTNLSSMPQIFDEIQKLSSTEEDCTSRMLKNLKDTDLTSYIVMDEPEMKGLFHDYTPDTVVSISRGLVDQLAERSGHLGLVAYYDAPSSSDLIQFRLRRSSTFKAFDLRKILTEFSIENGGGHPGAIGFRFPKDSITDIRSFTGELIDKIEHIIS